MVLRDWLVFDGRLIDLLKAVENGPIAQFWLERTPDKREVTGSSPVRPTSIRLRVRGMRSKVEANNVKARKSFAKYRLPKEYGGVAQLGERLPCTQEVIGSIPFTSTI